jgi:hypothetical protein
MLHRAAGAPCLRGPLSSNVRVHVLSPHISRSVRVLGLVLVLQLLVGCAVGTREIPLVDPLPVTGPAATVAVLREKQFCGSYPLNFILVDERPIAALATGEHTSFEVSPGSHTIGVFHHVIDMPLLIGGGPAAVPIGAHFGQYGTSVTVELVAGATHRFMLRSKCVTFDEKERVMIERVERWPDGAAPDPKSFVPAGKSRGTGAP